MKGIFLLFLFLSPYCFSAEPEFLSKYFIAIKKSQGCWTESLNSLENYTPLDPPEKRFYADPMCFKHKGINYIFFEDFDYKKGVIVYVTVDADLNISEPRLALELTHHVSFPYIFTEKDRIYMVPETAALGEVCLYEAVSFPDKWKKKKVLLEKGWYGDPILFKYNGYYWIFVTKDTTCGLHIYYSQNLFSKFEPHPVNTLDLKGRNAGALLQYEGKLIRPTMDCTESYGHSIVFNEIVELTPTTFIEREIRRMEPNWDPRINGTHTFNENEDICVYDGRYIIRKPD
jgi:hypothetical protein